MNTYPQPARSRCIRRTDQGKTITVQTLSPAINVLKFPPFSQKGVFAESFTGQRLRRKPFSSSCPASLQNRPASPSAHPLTEAVGTFTLEITWLKCTFAHFLLPHRYGMDKPWCFMLLRSKKSPDHHGLAAVLQTIYSPPRQHGHERNDKLQNENINHTYSLVSNIFVLASCHILRKHNGCAMLLPAKKGVFHASHSCLDYFL